MTAPVLVNGFYIEEDISETYQEERYVEKCNYAHFIFYFYVA
jgi:hypothetical protein